MYRWYCILKLLDTGLTFNQWYLFYYYNLYWMPPLITIIHLIKASFTFFRAITFYLMPILSVQSLQDLPLWYSCEQKLFYFTTSRSLQKHWGWKLIWLCRLQACFQDWSLSFLLTPASAVSFENHGLGLYFRWDGLTLGWFIRQETSLVFAPGYLNIYNWIHLYRRKKT